MTVTSLNAHPLASKKFEIAFSATREEVFEVLRPYTDLRPIAVGSYGSVVTALLATDATTRGDASDEEQTRVAIKKIRNVFSHPRLWLAAVRELTLLIFFNHENILTAFDVMIPLGEHNNLTLDRIRMRKDCFDEIYVVTQYMAYTLKDFMKYFNGEVVKAMKNPLCESPLDVSKSVSFEGSWDQLLPIPEGNDRLYILHQLLRGVEYMHACGVVHRDLKPENILIDENWAVKICDFGQSRSIRSPSSSSSSVSRDDLSDYDEPATHLEQTEIGQCTQWYAAPEHLRFSEQLRSTSTEINPRTAHGDDVWALGCIAAEMILGKPLFDASSCGGQGQLDCIVNILGMPRDDDIAAMQKHTPFKLTSHFETCRARGVKDCRLRQLLQAAGQQHGGGGDLESEIKLIERMLLWDPSKRPTASEALQDSMFTSPEGEAVGEPSPYTGFRKSDLTATTARRMMWDIFVKFHPEVDRLESALRSAEST